MTINNDDQRHRNDITSYFAFDDTAREVRCLRHDTPTPWMNYLSNGTFHTMLSQAGGGLAFYKSPQIWRISRYRFFHLPTDRSGPYLYLQDRASGEYWCPTFEPALLHPTAWESAHGLGYTRFRAERAGLRAEATYFVGRGENALLWKLTLSNDSAETKGINLYGYVEFGMMEFMRELQWQCYNKHQVSVSYRDDLGALIYCYGVETQPKPDETPLVYFTADRQPTGYDGDRDEFIGTYRSESNPYAIEHGGCSNSTLQGGDPCGALQLAITLAPGQSETVHFFLGTGMNEDEIAASVTHCREANFVSDSFAELQQEWSDYLEHFSCELPDQDAARMINIWNPYQAQRNFLYSRNISYYATGTFRGVGFRDTAQDILAQIPFDVEASKEKIRLLLREQYQDGHANHYFFPTEGWPPVTTIHSDDHLWPIWAVWSVVMETGDLSFLDEVLPYYDGGAATVYEHLRQAVDFTCAHLGVHGFPLMLRSDWNDQLFRVCREGKGESLWTAMQLGTMLLRLRELTCLMGRLEDAQEYTALYDTQQALINTIGWDGQWFRRAIMDNGLFLGTNENAQAKIWLNAQTWAVLSGMAEREKGIMAMNSVHELLDTELGIKKIHPAITDFPTPEDPLTNYHPGTGENAAIFCHANCWAIMAECLLGRGDQAYKYYQQLLPYVAMQKAGIWRYKAEPYVYASNLFGPESDKFGLANVSWLTGTAAWMYVAATQYILGVRPTWEGLLLAPCLPSDWPEVTINRTFRGCNYHICIQRTGVRQLVVDEEIIHGSVIPHVPGREMAEVRLTL